MVLPKRVGLSGKFRLVFAGKVGFWWVKWALVGKVGCGEKFGIRRKILVLEEKVFLAKKVGFGEKFCVLAPPHNKLSSLFSIHPNKRIFFNRELRKTVRFCKWIGYHYKKRKEISQMERSL